jgi:sugar transferase (PEP-CTERM/EpsH1 system associated)
MRILFLTPRLPYPPRKGDQVVAYHRLRTLSSRHEIVLLTLFERPSELEGVERLREYCSAVHAVRLPRWRSTLNMLALGAVTRTPFQVLYYRSAAFRRKLDELLRSEPFDVVHAFMLRLAPYLEHVRAPKVLEMIDSMELSMGRTAARSRGLRRLAYAEEQRRVRPYERNADRVADRLVFVSEIDRRMVPSDRSVALPNGVDPAATAEAPPAGSSPIVVFSGNMGYAPNVDAASWFVHRCWGGVRAALPAAELRIVGASPAPAVEALAARPGVRVTGFVPEMAAVLREAAVAVAPMQSGAGMQNKILEAMACGIPVVTTTLGLGAIAARPGEEVLVEDDPARFAASVVALLRDGDRRRALGASGRAYVNAHHSWEEAARRVDAMYATLVGARPAPEASTG